MTSTYWPHQHFSHNLLQDVEWSNSKLVGPGLQVRRPATPLNYITATIYESYRRTVYYQDYNEEFTILFFCTFTVFGNFLGNTSAISSFSSSRNMWNFPPISPGLPLNSWASAPSALFFWTIIHHNQNDSSLRISVNGSCRFEFASTERKLNFKLQKQCLKPPYRVHNSLSPNFWHF